MEAPALVSAGPAPRPAIGRGPLMPGAIVAPRPERHREFMPNATLAERVELTPLIARFVVRPDAAVPPFRPGQYFSLGLQIEGQLVLRPYSTASPRGATQSLEFLVRYVPTGTFKPALWRAAAGDRIWIGPPKGLFTLRSQDTRTHLFVSSGTGLAPFMSMLDDVLGLTEARGDAEPAAGAAGCPRVVVAHGVSYQTELAYRDRLERLATRDGRLVYVPTVSRPDHPANAAWAGRSGRVESILGQICGELKLGPAETIAYLCGNPDMIESSRTALAGLGFADDAIVREHYWTPAGLP